MLGADTRSTSDTTVADKNCEKIHFIAPNIYCCGAGTAADTENVTGAALFRAAGWPGASVTLRCVLTASAPGMVSSALELHRYATDRESRVVTAMTMLKSHLFRRARRLCWALKALLLAHSKCPLWPVGCVGQRSRCAGMHAAIKVWWRALGGAASGIRAT